MPRAQRPLLKPATAIAALFLASGTASASAKTCSDVAISARGEPARYVWLAKTKARANWRRQVRATTGLGTEYGNWGQAETTEEQCITGGGKTHCIFTGYPCKQ